MRVSRRSLAILLAVLPVSCAGITEDVPGSPKDERGNHWHYIDLCRSKPTVKEEDAVEWMTEAIRWSGETAWAFLMRGRAYAALGRFDEADADLREYESFCPGHPDVLKGWAEVREARAKAGKAEAKAAIDRSAEVEEHLRLARAALAAKDVKRAKECYVAAINLDPCHGVAHKERADLLLEGRLPDKIPSEPLLGYSPEEIISTIADDYSHWLRGGQGSARDYLVLGFARLRLLDLRFPRPGRTQTFSWLRKAEMCFEYAGVLDPKDWRPWWGTAEAESALYRAEEARYPGYEGFAEATKAFSACTKAIELGAAGEPVVYRTRGLLNDRLGHYGDAARDYEEAMRLDPSMNLKLELLGARLNIESARATAAARVAANAAKFEQLQRAKAAWDAEYARQGQGRRTSTCPVCDGRGSVVMTWTPQTPGGLDSSGRVVTYSDWSSRTARTDCPACKGAGVLPSSDSSK